LINELVRHYGWVVTEGLKLGRDGERLNEQNILSAIMIYNGNEKKEKYQNGKINSD
jgi:hypothetical protein